MTRWIWASLVGTVAGVVAPASAAPFYMEFDPARGFPEEQGFTRILDEDPGPHVRSIENGVFSLDTRNSLGGDYYGHATDALNLAPGETLTMRWTMRTVETLTSGFNADVGVTIGNAAGGPVEIMMSPSWVSVVTTSPRPVKIADITPGAFHNFEFVTTDMRTFTLAIDDQIVFAGLFRSAGLVQNRVAFGDVFAGLSSLSEWSVFNVRVTPEPSTFVLLTILLTLRRRQ